MKQFVDIAVFLFLHESGKFSVNACLWRKLIHYIRNDIVGEFLFIQLRLFTSKNIIVAISEYDKIFCVIEKKSWNLNDT